MILNISLAWLQLVKQRDRFIVALGGIAFVAVLIFLQIGFQDALYASATQLHNNFQADLFLISAQYQSLTSNQSFSRSRLYQTLGFDGVDSITPLYAQFAKIKNPHTGRKYPIYVIGYNPVKSVFKLPEIQQKFKTIQIPDRVLFDRASRPEFGPIAQEFEQKKKLVLKFSVIMDLLVIKSKLQTCSVSVLLSG